MQKLPWRVACKRLAALRKSPLHRAEAPARWLPAQDRLMDVGLAFVGALGLRAEGGITPDRLEAAWCVRAASADGRSRLPARKRRSDFGGKHRRKARCVASHLTYADKLVLTDALDGAAADLMAGCSSEELDEPDIIGPELLSGD